MTPKQKSIERLKELLAMEKMTISEKEKYLRNKSKLTSIKETKHI